MIDPSDRHLSIVRQREFIGVSRSHHYYTKCAPPRADIEEMIKLKELFIKYPIYGYREQVLESGKRIDHLNGKTGPPSDERIRS
ncbi:hypothetical protein [Marispirochaeta aestuarii]|uniref:hypothetical protein n=1 Tax=Marispirochaeta aestuarii TaxID=1963862 RepID=UPI0029C784A2|nr:hypothetical protein [Marispirochaeta aestuarii]